MSKGNDNMPPAVHQWRVRFLAAGPVLLAGIVLLISWQWHGSGAHRASDWRQRAQRCMNLADEIRELRNRPRRFQDRVLESHAVAAYVEQAAARAGVTLQQISAIRPEPPQRVRDSDYVQTLVKLRLSDLSQEQLARLVFDLEQSVPGMTIRQMRMWAPSADAQTWEVELSLLGLSYIPAKNQELL
jgi:hypothetical protein